MSKQWASAAEVSLFCRAAVALYLIAQVEPPQFDQACCAVAGLQVGKGGKERGHKRGGRPRKRVVVMRSCPDAPGRNLRPVLGPVVPARLVPYHLLSRSNRRSWISLDTFSGAPGLRPG